MDIFDMMRVSKPTEIKFKTFEHDLFNFDEMLTENINGKRHYVTPTGEKYPSMTTLLKCLDDENVLNFWRKRVGFEEAERQTQEAADRGNVLHDLSERYLLNTLTNDDIGYGHGDMMFRNAMHILDKIQVVHAVEVPLYSHKLKFAGRCDAIVTLDNSLTIADHKNSKKLLKNAKKAYLKDKMYKYQVQTFGYAEALYEMTGKEATHGALIVSKPKLNYDEEYESELIHFKFSDGNYNEVFEMVLDFYYK